MSYTNNPFAPINSLEGVTTLDGKQIIVITTADQTAFVPALEFADGGAAAMRTLRNFNLAPLPQVRADMMKRVGHVTDFPIGAFLGRPGHTKPYFTLQDGHVFTPAGVAEARAVFPRFTRQLGQKGALRGWKRHVAEPVVGNVIPCFLLMLPFAPVIADLHEGIENVGWEIAGTPATGKTTGLMLCASVIGGAVDRETSYSVSLNATANALEHLFPMYRDMLLVLEEGQLFSASDTPKVRAAKWSELAHRLSDGTSKLRAQYGVDSDVTAQQAIKLWFVLNTNVPIAEVLGGADSDADKAVLQRIQTIPSDRKYGIYDKLPKRVFGGHSFSNKLRSAMRKHYGVAMRSFLERLIEDLHTDESGLRSRVAHHMALFAREVQLNEDDGEEARAAKSFGLVYTAGMLAKHYEVLPKSFKPLRVALKCHALHRASVVHRQTFEKRLKQYASRNDLVRVTDGNYPELTDQQLRRCPGVIVVDRSGDTYLRMSGWALRRAFPDWRAVKHVAVRYMETDGEGGRIDPKRKVRSNVRQDRVRSFKLD